MSEYGASEHLLALLVLTSVVLAGLVAAGVAAFFHEPTWDDRMRVKSLDVWRTFRLG